MLESKGFQSLTASELKTFATRLSYLVSFGCRPYELVEYPTIVLLDKSEIDKRIEKLRLSDTFSRISISLLKYAIPEKSNSVMNASITKYLKPLGGYVNKVDEIVQELSCSDMKMMEILTRNPRLLGRKYRKDIADKIRCLISHGARHEDLYQNTNLLNNSTLATIQSRAERLNKLGWIPLPLGLLGRVEAEFEAVVRRREAQGHLLNEPHVARADDVIRLLPPMSANRIARVRPKIEYLLSEGYAVSDIVNCPRTLSRSLQLLQMAVCELRPYHLQCVDLATINHYAVNRRILSSRRMRFLDAVARVIGCSRATLPPLPKDKSIRAVQDVQHTAEINTRYLRDELGFTAEDLASVPLVLGHAPDVVRQRWNALSDVDDEQSELSYGGRQTKALFRRHADNGRLRLNLLQYYIEKEANFSHACVSSWTENSDDEFVLTESTSLAAADDSDTDDGEPNFLDDGDDECAGPDVDRFGIVDENSDDESDPLIV